MPFRQSTPSSGLGNTQRAFAACVDYLLQLGVTPNNVRIRRYDQFIRQVETDDVDIDPVTAVRLWREVHELIWVIDAFRKSDINPPVDLLLAAMKGKPLDEYESEPGRNLFLQLRAAVYFIWAQYSVTLDGECDIVATRGRRRIFVECKRLYSERKSKARVRECYKQLEKRLAGAGRSRHNLGLAWIDPSPAMQKNYFVYSAYSEAGARHAARMDLIYFWRKWIGNAYAGPETRIFAQVLQMIWPSWLGSEGVRTGFTSYIVPGSGKIGFLSALRARRLLDELYEFEGAGWGN